MKNLSCFLASFILISSSLFAQVGINADNSAPDPSAGLDVKFNNKGVLFPRLTQAEISTIANPANGLQVFCTTDSKMYIYVSTVAQWKEVAYGTGTITPSFPCGSSLIINHVVGDVAPVSKTVTYGIVTNIPGESAKCWITSNLGADHQAMAKDDATEASSGWYWQFNKKQGYKHDGTSLTPNTTWISSINENSNWTPANDPCTLELGSGWRIPTLTEWTNVDASGNWTNWNGPWNSALKIHAAGYLYYSDGSLNGRGSNGDYWSSMQSDAANGWRLYFYNNYSFVNDNSKTYGFPLRCLREN